MKFFLGSLLVFWMLQAQALELASTDIQAGKTLTQAQVFNGFGCQGDNLSPQLAWNGAPKETKSYAITVYDPDAPTGSGWWHWTVFNIPASTNSLLRGSGKPDSDLLPVGAVQGRTDFGAPGFGGACPPPGDAPHRYQFTVWALDTDKLPLDENASGALVGFMLNVHVLDKATLTTKYAR